MPIRKEKHQRSCSLRWCFFVMAKLGLCGFTGRDLLVTTSGGPILRCTFFTNLSTKPTTSGGHIFLCVKKDMEERHAKGLQSRPLDSGFLYGGLEGRRAYLTTCAPECNYRDLGPPGGVPVVFALRGFAGKPSTTFFRQLIAESTASAGLMRTARTAANA